jgi:leucyl/phenylalanyl-tRNA--protein transferase
VTGSKSGLPIYGSSRMSRLPRSRYFPAAEDADENGIVCVGGELRTAVLLDAYRHGIFPWPMFDDDLPMLWWSPDPRGVIEFDKFHVSRRLERTCRSGKFQVTSDRDFAGVIHGCATTGERHGSTWLTAEMIRAYRGLHHLGHAHSVEVWHDGELAGGVYGVAIGGLFAGESMFHRVRDASKVALTYLVRHLRQRGYRLFDLQQLNAHTASMGGTGIPRREYLRRLSEAIALPIEFGELQT